MKLVIDHLTDATGWIINSPSTIKEIERRKLIAGLNSKSLMITFDRADTVKTVTKTFATPFDVRDYETLVLSLWSAIKGFNTHYLKIADYSYKININGVTDFYIPIYNNFHHIEIGIEDIDEINQIEITALHPDSDAIVISEMIVEKEEIQIDMLKATKEHIDFYIEQLWSDGMLLQTLTANAGDNSIILSNPPYLDRYGVVKIDDGVNSEIHQISDTDANEFILNDNFDGDSILNDFINAECFLQFPSYINPGQAEIRLPGIAIWGIEPEAILRGSKLDTQRDSFTDTQSKERTEGQILKYTVLLTCESHSQELLSYMAKAVRRFIAQESLWINGRRHDVEFSGPGNEIPSNSAGIDHLPQIQYSFNVEVKENINDRVAVPITSAINIPVDVKE